MTVRGKAGRRDAAKNHPVAIDPIGAHTVLSTLSTVQTLTPPSDPINALYFQATVQNVRYTLDGTTPSASVGFVAVANDRPTLVILTQETSAVKFIEATASATLNYQWAQVATEG